MIYLLWMMACSPGSNDSGTTQDEYDGPIVQPVLRVDSPLRGSFTGSGSVEVSGQASAGTWDLASLEMGGVPIDLGSDGTFSQVFELDPGLQILGLRLEDAGGERAVEGLSVYHGPVHEPGAWIEGGIRLHIGPGLLDDDDDDLDDVASFAERFLSDASLLDDFVDQPIETEYVTVTPTYMYYSGVDADFTLGDGTLTAELTVSDPYMEFSLTDIVGYSWLSTSGSAQMDASNVVLTLAPRSENGEVVVDVVSVTTSQEGFDLELSWVPGFLEDFLEGYIADEIESQIQELVESEVPPLIEDFLDSLLIEGDVGSGLVLEVELASLDVVSTGIHLTGDGRVHAESLDLSSLPDGAGSLQTKDSAPAWPTGDAAFTLLLDDDLANQLLFGMWAMGDFGGYAYSGLKIGILMGAPLPEPLGPADTVSLELGLPPVLSATESEGSTLDISIGEFRLGFNREDGELLDFSVNVRAGASLTLNEEQGLDIAMDNRPAQMDMAVGTLQSPDGVDPGDLAAFIRLITPTLLGNASNFLPSLYVPTIPIEDLVDLEELAGLELHFVDTEVRVDASHWTQISGSLEVQ